MWLYQEGVKQSDVKKYRVADSLFTLSADLEPHPDTYFNRAAIRARLNNKKGYCEDMACAAAMVDEESLRLFCKECGKADTSFNNSDTLQVWQAAYTVTYSSKYFETPLVGRHNAKKRLIGFGWFNNADSENKNDSLVQKVDEPVRFPGGLDGLSDFIQSN